MPKTPKGKEVILEYLKGYIELNEDEESILSSRLSTRTYLKGQYIAQHGDISKHVTFILSGLARTFYLDDRGNEHNIIFGSENWWVGDLGSFVSQTPADFNIQCLENTKVFQISYDDIQQLYDDVPKMERFFRMIIERAYAAMSKRMVRNYSLTAKERYALFCDEYPALLQRLPQYMIASYLGISKEFLSSIRNKGSQES